MSLSLLLHEHPPPLSLHPSLSNEWFWNDFNFSTKIYRVCSCEQFGHQVLFRYNKINITLIVTSAVHIFSAARLTSCKKVIFVLYYNKLNFICIKADSDVNGASVL